MANNLTRRDFVKYAVGGGVALTASGYGFTQPKPYSRVIGANDDIRIGIVGFHGHGRSHISGYREVKGVRLVALCDPERDVLEGGVQDFAKRNEKPEAYTDLRKLLDNPDIDAISGATPNHWHALTTVWACQAGKDACVEKPVSHNIFEGRQEVVAARKYKRIVQADLDRRTSEGRRKAIAYIQSGKLGKILFAHGFVYKRRKSMGKVSGPQKPPDNVDFNLWCGPSALELKRKRLHYEWHWQWETGCGETGNNGPHVLDEIRWALGQKSLPRRVMGYGGRFGYDDDGNTPNTQVSIYDYKPAPIIFEVRGLPRKTGDGLMDSNWSRTATGMPIRLNEEKSSPNNGVVIVCEDGYMLGSAVYDNNTKKIKEFTGDSGFKRNHFPRAMRSRKLSDLRTDILEGHLSTALCHLGNIAYRVGRETNAEEILAASQSDPRALEVFNRFRDHLAANDVNLRKDRPALGTWLEFDPKTEKFTGGLNHTRANQLLTRDYREPFVVREKV